MDSFKDTWNGFAVEAKKIISKFDSDHDSALSDSELAKALQDSTLDSTESKVVSIFASHRSSLDKPNLPPLSLSEIDSIASKIPVLEAGKKRFEKLSALVDDFDKIDKDKSGSLTKLELESYAASSDGSFFSNHGAAEPLFDEISSDGSKKRVVDLRDEFTDLNVWKTSLHACEVMDSLTPARPLSAFVHDTSRLKDISPYVGRQGNLGDCYFQSAVSAIAKTNPAVISRMIEDNGNGTYTVRFPNQEKIVVAKPTRSEQLVFNGASKEGSWVSILEKAYGVLEERRTRTFGVPQLALNDGGKPGRVFADFTGREARTIGEFEFALMSEAEMKKVIKSAFETGRPMCCGTVKSGFKPVTDRHSYTIVGFNPTGADGGTVTLHNPWNDSNTKYGNMISISLRQFKKWVSHISIGQY